MQAVTEQRKIAALAERIWAGLKKGRPAVRSAVLVVMAGLVAYLISIVAAIPINSLMEHAIQSPRQMSVATRTILAALSLDLPKGVALAAVGFAFGRFMALRLWPSAVGLTLVTYLYDAAVGYVTGIFKLAWAHAYALAGRIPLLVLFAVTTALVTWGGSRLRARKEDSAPGPAPKPAKPAGD